MLYFLKFFLSSLLISFAHIACSEEISKSNAFDQILNNYEQIKQDSCREAKKNKNGFYILVSFNMPKNLLEQYDLIAKKTGAKLVIRGFKNNSFKDTVLYTQNMVMEVNPVIFKKYSINSVPSFVLVEGERFDKLTGNVSIIYALEQFKNHGDLREKAETYLKRIMRD